MQEYNKTDQQLHFLSQLIAKANRAFAPKKDDDSHTNLFFDPLGNRITGRWINLEKNKVLFTLNLDTQAIEILGETGKPIAGVATISKHIEEVEQEIEKVLPDLGLKPKIFIEPLHYEIPNYDFAQHPIEKIDPKGLSQWKQFRRLANNACFQVLGFTQMWEEVRIWPHHFDTGIYIEPKNNLGVGFGLAMEDSMAGSAYFYLAGYPHQGKIRYEDLPQFNFWEWIIENNWKGVILKLDMIQKQNEAERLDSIGQYITENIKWFLSHEN